MALLEREGCAVLVGPPGTGKTHTIANVICAFPGDASFSLFFFGSFKGSRHDAKGFLQVRRGFFRVA